MLIYVPVYLVNLNFFFINSFTVWEFLRNENVGNDDTTWKLLDGPHIDGFRNYCSLNNILCKANNQRWSPQGRFWPRGRPRGHILKSLASRPQVLENWPVLGSRTALFFELLKFCGALKKFFGKRFFVEIS